VSKIRAHNIIITNRDILGFFNLKNIGAQLKLKINCIVNKIRPILSFLFSENRYIKKDENIIIYKIDQAIENM